MKTQSVRILCAFALLVYSIFTYSLAFGYQPKVGDLYFQDLNCGELCDAITTSTYGYDHTQVSHVAMLVKTGEHPEVIEATTPVVQQIPLEQFLARSVDENGNPRVMVGRLDSQYQSLIPQAVMEAQQWIGQPYNRDFRYHNHEQRFYCSQLVYQAFAKANHGVAIFPLNTMTFKMNGQTLPAWQAYFADIGEAIPEGHKGTNPGMMSRDQNIKIIHYYGQLRRVGA